MKYYSQHNNKNTRPSTNWSKKDLATWSDDQRSFAERTSDAFAGYISFEHWGINKKHAIPKALWIAKSKKEKHPEQDVYILNADGSPWLNKNGTPRKFGSIHYRYWGHNKIPKAINGEEKHYYMSPSRCGKKLPYLDLDAHAAWQDDLPDAIDLLKEIFKSQAYYRYSPGGYNGWIKIGDAPTDEEYNLGLSRLENVLKRIFSKKKIKTDIEIKGKSHKGTIKEWSDSRAQLAKLPYWNHQDPTQQRDADDVWDDRRLDEWESTPDIRWESLMAVCDQLEQQLEEEPEPVIIEEQPLTCEMFSADAENKSNPSGGSTCDSKMVDLSKPVPSSLEEVQNLDDAFERQHLFAMWFCRQQKRVVSVEELLQAIKEYEMYRGEWSDGEENRRRRCQDILQFVAQSFDSEKCGTGEGCQRPKLDQNITNWKAKAWRLPSQQRMNLIILAAIIQTASKSDGDCPRNSIQGWWEELAQDGICCGWSKDKYYAARRVLVEMGVIKIDHKRYRYIPDAKGQCKGIWINERRKSTTTADYKYPVTTFTFLHNCYVRRTWNDFQINDPWEEVRPPP